MSKTIELTRGKVAIVDDDDFDYLSQFNWYCDGDGYACRGFQRHKKIFMHRVVNVTPVGYETDHINRNKLDNRKCNLRTCTNTENQLNKSPLRNNKSGYKGVCFAKRKGMWQASITVDKNVLWLGYFSDVISAAKAFDTAARNLYGRSVYLNFPEEN